MDERQRFVHDLKSENVALKRELDCYRAKFGEIPPEELLQLSNGSAPRMQPSVFDNPDTIRTSTDSTVVAAIPEPVQVAQQDAPPARLALPPSSPGSCQGSHHGSRPGSREAAQRRKPKHTASPLASPGRPPPQPRSPERGERQGRGRSEPPRIAAPAPAPPPAPVAQPPAPGRASSEAPKRAVAGPGYAMVAAKRKSITEAAAVHLPPRRKPPAPSKGGHAGLPPIPGRPVSGGQGDNAPLRRQVGDASNGFDEKTLQALRRGSGIAESHPQLRQESTNEAQSSPSGQRASSVDASLAPAHSVFERDGQLSPVHSVQSTQSLTPSAKSVAERCRPPDVQKLPLGGASPRSTTPVVPVIKAQPSTKIKERRPSKVQVVNPELTASMIKRLDSTHCTEWEFDFGGPDGPKRAGREREDVPSRASSSRGSSLDSSRASSRTPSPSDSLTGAQADFPKASQLPQPMSSVAGHN